MTDNDTTSLLTNIICCWLPLASLLGIPAAIVLLLRRRSRRGDALYIRTDDFIFIKSREGHIIRKGLNFRNWVALAFFSLVTLGILGLFVSIVVAGTFEWGTLVLLGFSAITGYVVVYLIRLIRVPPLRFDALTRVVEWEQDGHARQVSFSDIQDVAVSYTDDPEYAGQYRRHEVAVCFKDGSWLGLARLSGKKERAGK